MMKCAEAVNTVYENIVRPGANLLFGGFARTYDHIATNEGKVALSDALKEGFKADKGSWDAITMGEKGKEYYLSGSAIGLGAAGLGIGYRFLSGGGAYRDKNGNTDLAGVPFV